ncbi:hypothetical protein PHYBLDRAFT_139398 [Phycomyces blakesleeanus NRRL 1555(-)]|uniref:Homeodomain-like DNA binding domain-containing transcription factor n=1 Tax=Phycomyces blakesleeanus (strain ATCC 8743b / DSM 1359 / FGSC 10004 / NBRC 33097 / NRRL 1555) TaxID=763407 RepID=A0A167QAI3_PHYB8|nr:hypothetical protein PHYBLDRAFT_139398 [Phycomyces blakesleeanus NRRL 1555(-)]OAD79368.1 hypothetical protein PHYBLDRAFT_139398 [Phycomyces blakesleeanus NRRL 1555(-)]|eukprot:XP_018297408.1 hypothetical protein PHYBLDRAFT_139398 [Phycomyces blakesleeanus NRRL 1555(-)]
MPSNATRKSGRKGKQNAQGTLSCVAAGRIEQREIAPRVSPLAAGPSGAEAPGMTVESLTQVMAAINMMYDRTVEANTGIRFLVDAHNQAIAQQALVASSVTQGVTAANVSTNRHTKGEMHAIVLNLINRRMWARNFRSNDSELVAENKSRRRWNTDERIDHPDNVEVINYLRQYIVAQPRTAGFWEDMIVQKIKNNYKTCFRAVNATPEQASSKRRNNHINSRRIEQDTKMGYKPGNPDEMAYLHLLEKSVMSDGESEDEDVTPIICVQVLQVARPSWRSAELNRLIQFIDFLAAENDKKIATPQSKQRMLRYLKTIAVTPVPGHLTAILPVWTIQNQ